MNKKTKIVCTIGPSTDSQEMLESLLKAGMNVARFNFSHGSHEEHARRIEAVRDASRATGIPVALMLDTKGPEIRLGRFKEGSVELVAGSQFILTSRDVEGDATICSVTHTGLPQDVKAGHQILLSDGLVTLEVVEVRGEDIITKVLNSGKMSDRKRVAVPGVSITLPPVSEQDEKDLRFACKMDLDYIAASFVQRGSDVVAIRRILEEEDVDIRIISKIENEEGLQNLQDIISMSDGIMVARGDLGVEIPPEEVPVIQKHMIQQCHLAAKPVITATQMLESMVNNPRPTRAEASDVANAILDGTDAIMLSGETANGNYPLEAVETMARIAKVTESSDLYRGTSHLVDIPTDNTTDAISVATVKIAHNLDAAAIITCTESGLTPMSISRNRPNCRLIAVTPYDRIVRRMQLFWGVEAILGDTHKNTDEMVHCAMSASIGEGLITSGDLVVVTAGVPSGFSGTTNMIRVHVTGDVIIKGQGIGMGAATGHVRKAYDGSHPVFHEGDILVVHELEADHMKFAELAGAIITGEEGFTSSAAIVGINFHIPVILGAHEAFKVLEENQLVTVDGVRGKVYAGAANAR